MLVFLVLGLFLAVAILAISVWNLRDSANSSSSRVTVPARTVPVRDPVAEAREAELERRIGQLQDEVATLRRELRSRPDPAASASPGNGGGPGDGEPGGWNDYPPIDPSGRYPRDANGDFLVTPEDVAYFTEVQQRVERRRRVEGMIRGVMLRVDRLEKRGEIRPLPDDRRREVEDVIRKYVAKGDDLLTRYVRSPDEELRSLSPEQRRDELATARSDIVAAAQSALEPILGVEDAAKVAEESLQRPWGLRGASRRLGTDR